MAAKPGLQRLDNNYCNNISAVASKLSERKKSVKRTNGVNAITLFIWENEFSNLSAWFINSTRMNYSFEERIKQLVHRIDYTEDAHITNMFSGMIRNLNHDTQSTPAVWLHYSWTQHHTVGKYKQHKKCNHDVILHKPIINIPAWCGGELEH